MFLFIPIRKYVFWTLHSVTNCISKRSRLGTLLLEMVMIVVKTCYNRNSSMFFCHSHLRISFLDIIPAGCETPFTNHIHQEFTFKKRHIHLCKSGAGTTLPMTNVLGITRDIQTRGTPVAPAQALYMEAYTYSVDTKLTLFISGCFRFL